MMLLLLLQLYENTKDFDKSDCLLSMISNKERIQNAIEQNQQNDAFIYACEVGELEMVREMLSNVKVDPTTDDQQAFKLACQYGHVEIVKLLLKDARIDITAENQYSFKFSCQNGKMEIVQLLSNDGRVDDKAKQSGARLARKYGHEEIAMFLDPKGETKPNPKQCGIATNAREQAQQGWAKPTGSWMEGNSNSAGRSQ
jgi:ankyrin repeat protein